jgi:hypothetical protein
MRDLLLELKASTHGETFRLVATGVRPIGGSAQFSTAKPLPQELVRALNRYLEEIDSSVGTWSHTIGLITYEVNFTSV